MIPSLCLVKIAMQSTLEIFSSKTVQHFLEEPRLYGNQSDRRGSAMYPHWLSCSDLRLRCVKWNSSPSLLPQPLLLWTFPFL